MGELALVGGNAPSDQANALIAQAIDKGVTVETMEKLLAMRRELAAEWARQRYFESLAEFQAECPIIVKAKSVKGKDGKERYRFAPMDVIDKATRAPRKKHGFSHIITTAQTETSLTATCTVHHVAGHSESTSLTVPIDNEAYMSAPQKVGSARTYAMRYAFCDAYGILTGDEDNDAVQEDREEPRDVTPGAEPKDFGPPPKEFWDIKKTRGWDEAKAYLGSQFLGTNWKVEKRDDGWHCLGTPLDAPTVDGKEVPF